MNRKQMAYRIISAQADTIVFDIDCGSEELANKSKDELVETIYKFLLSGTRAQHFKFLTADWIKQTIAAALEKAGRKWGIEIK